MTRKSRRTDSFPPCCTPLSQSFCPCSYGWSILLYHRTSEKAAFQAMKIDQWRARTEYAKAYQHGDLQIGPSRQRARLQLSPSCPFMAQLYDGGDRGSNMSCTAPWLMPPVTENARMHKSGTRAVERMKADLLVVSFSESMCLLPGARRSWVDRLILYPILAAMQVV